MEKVLLGISGGVDSSVSALLLRDKYNVIATTLKLWAPDSENNINDSKAVCDQLGIEHVVIDMTDKFNKCVIKYFINEYKNIKTPNPCIECNKHIKFGEMYKEAEKLGCNYIATGHYAKVEYDDKYKRYVIKKAANLEKDQSYFLYTIDKNILDHILFPLGSYKSKDEIRKIATDNNLKTHSKEDSQDICFIEDGDYKKFLEENDKMDVKGGNIIYKGKILKQHDGLYKYTIGQRKGLGVSNIEPLYVIDMDRNSNDLVLGTIDDLYKSEFMVSNVNLQAIDTLNDKMHVNVKIRYKAKEVGATIENVNNKIKVILDTKEKSITPGQSAVFYDGDILIGGGIIE